MADKADFETKLEPELDQSTRPIRSKSRGLRFLAHFALYAAIICFTAGEFGIMGAILLNLGLCMLAAFLLGLRSGMTLYESYTFSGLGAVVGLVMAGLLGPVLSLLGYEEETGPRKEREAAFVAVDAAMRRAATAGLAPFDRSEPGVAAALDRLPESNFARPGIVGDLIQRLDDPDPVVRAEVVLALGRYEGETTRILPLLEVRLKAPDPRMRAAAIVALAGMRPWLPALEAQILAALADPDDRVQVAAVTALLSVKGFLRADQDGDRLRAAAVNSTPTTRMRVAALADQLGTR